MATNTRWMLLLAACAGAALAVFATQTRRQRHLEKQAHKADLHEWENEGGNLAPPPEPADSAPAASSP